MIHVSREDELIIRQQEWPVAQDCELKRWLLLLDEMYMDQRLHVDIALRKWLTKLELRVGGCDQGSAQSPNHNIASIGVSLSVQLSK